MSFIEEISKLINTRSIIMYLVALAPLSYIIFEIYHYGGTQAQADRILIDFVIGIIWLLFVIVLETGFSFKEINGKIDLRNSQIRVIENSKQYFSFLEYNVICSKTILRLMNLDEHPPTKAHYSDYEVRKRFFDTLIEFAQGHKDVKIRRIVSIPDQERFEWVKSEIEKTKDCPEFHFAYIKIDRDKPRFFKSVTGCNIIDENKIFLFNPITDVVHKTFKPCIFVENQPVSIDNQIANAENQPIIYVYKGYFDLLWSELEAGNSEIGYLLKGNAINTENLNRLEKFLQK